MHPRRFVVYAPDKLNMVKNSGFQGFSFALANIECANEDACYGSGGNKY
jgi:hypothetical protein